MPTFIMALLIVAALGLLASSWLSGRRDRDPSSSVNHFHRAMAAMQNATPPSPRSVSPDPEVDAEAAAVPGTDAERPDGVVARR